MHKFTLLIISIIYFYSWVFPTLLYADQNASGNSAKLVAVSSVKPIADKRVKVLKSFLESYKSPLASNAEVFVREADKNNIDWRLVACISGVESTFGKHLPYNSYNAWGWGIYGTNVIYFDSYEHGITTISKGLRENYMNKWKAKNVYEIGRIYAASPTWADKVTFFMNKIDKLDVKTSPDTLSITL